METIGDKIKRLRKAKGYSLMDLAEKIGVSDMAISKIERGKTKSITVDLGKAIANALEVSFNELFDIDAPSTSIDQTENLIAEIETLKKQLDEKENIIELLQNEKKHIKHGFTSQINGDCYWGVIKIDREILEAKDEIEKNKLQLKRDQIISDYKRIREHNIKMGLLTDSDFKDNYEYLSWLYENMPENEILK